MTTLPPAAIGASALVRALGESRPDVLAFYAHDPAGPLADAARIAADHAQHREAVADVLAEQNAAWGADEATLALVDRLRDPASVAVVSGQQLGLFAGPLYTVYKALTAVRLAARVEAETGRPAVPVFWLADEDHDFEEVHAAVFTDDEQVRTAAYDDGLALDAPARPPVGRIVLDAARLAQTFAELERALPAGPVRADALALARDAYRPGRTMRDAFAVLLRALVGACPGPRSRGLVLMSADDARLKRLAAPVLIREAAQWRETAQILDDRSAALVAAGFHAQIAPSPLGLFWIDDDGLRRPVDPLDVGDTESDVTLRGTDVRWTAAEWRARVAAHPERVSPNVVLRPLVQDTLLPTVAYVAGPGEAAYYAQIAPVYAAFGVPMPAIVPRLSLTLVEPGVRRTLGRYGLDVPDLRGDLNPHWSRLALAGTDVPAAFADARRDADALTARLDALAADVGGSLAGASGAMQAAIRKAIDRMESKTVRVERRRHDDVRARLARAQTALWPGGTLQERALAPLQLVALHGPDVFTRVIDAVPFDPTVHHVVDL